MLIAIVVRTSHPHRQAEALRAALGLTLRGARVAVVLDEPPATPLAARAIETLESFGFVVSPDRAPLAAADRVEVWT